MIQRGSSQIEERGRIELAREQTFFRFVEADGIAEIGFGDFARAGDVDQQSVPFGYRLHPQGCVFVSCDTVARPETNAVKRRIAAGILALLRRWS